MTIFLVCLTWYLSGLALTYFACVIQNAFVLGREKLFYLRRQDKAAIFAFAVGGPFCIMITFLILANEAVRDD